MCAFSLSLRNQFALIDRKGMHWRFILSKNKYSPSCLLIYLITTALGCMLTCATINPVLVQIQKYTHTSKNNSGLYLYLGIYRLYLGSKMLLFMIESNISTFIIPFTTLYPCNTSCSGQWPQKYHIILLFNRLTVFSPPKQQWNKCRRYIEY